MAECQYNYVVTAQRATAVTHSVVGRITGPDHTDLIIGKSTCIELYTLQKEGLQPVLESPVNGRIAVLKLFRSVGEDIDCVMLLTERYDVCTLRFDATLCEWRTLSTGCLHQRVGRETRNGPLVIIDSQYQICAFHLYSCIIKIMSIDVGRLVNTFTLHMDELNILHMCLLPSLPFNTQKPVLALLYEDNRYARHLKTYFIDMEQKLLEDGCWVQYNMINAAELIIPVLPYGGIILLGESMISYLSNTQPHMHIPVHETTFKGYGMIDPNRYLISDHMGHLYILVLITANNAVSEIVCQRIGEASPAATISYLDSGIVFIGSTFGNSQLIKLISDTTMQTSPVQIISTFTNLGPIIDFCVVDLERQGQCQVVTCSGAYTQGSLRVIRNGIGITEQATVELPGIKGLWSLKKSWNSLFDEFLVISFANETRALTFSSEDSEELIDAEINGFEHSKQTLHCANLVDDAVIQVTPKEARLISLSMPNLSQTWNHEDTRSIIFAANSPSQVMLACDSGELFYFIVHSNELIQEEVFQTEEEISCIDLTPIGEDATASQFAAVGSWEMTILIYNLTEKRLIMKMNISKDAIPRSVLFSRFEGLNFLLIAMGDGKLVTYDINPTTGELADEKRVSIGTKPVTLKKFWTKGTSYVFASSDRPTVIYGDQKKLMFSTLNESNVNLLVSFHTPNVPDCLALAKDGNLTVGNIDDIQKLHIRSIHLHEMPRRICHQPETKSFGVLVESFTAEGRPQSYFRIFDHETFEVKKSFAFALTETGISLISMKLPDRHGDEKNEVFFLVGTAYNVPTECEPSKGRILAFTYNQSQGYLSLNNVAVKEFDGAVFSIKPILDRILATVGSKVHVLEWRVREDGSKDIYISCTQHCHILAVYSDVRSNFVIIGDLMRSISFLVYDRQKNELEIRSKDTNSNWMTGVKALDDEIFLGSDNSYNLITVKKGSSAVRAEEGKLEMAGAYHLGEVVNTFREGSLVARSDLDIFIRPPVIFGTVTGQLGLILSLTKEKYLFLEKLQAAMQTVIQPLGQLEHSKYRCFVNDRRSCEAKNFIDGDLIEAYLDLKRHTMEEVAQMMESTHEEIYKLVEDLSKLH